MARASLTIRILTFSVCLFCAHTADLMCDDIVSIIKRHGDQRNWYYSNPTQYKNRNCDRCYVDRDGEDCQLKEDGSESCPRLIGIDSTPAESENWICPRHCYNMPEIPYQVKVSKTTSTYKCDSIFACGTEFKDITPRFFNVEMPNAFKIVDASSYNYDESADPNTYGVRPISLCKTKRYEDNFNVRVVSCWRWNYLSNKPSMTHLDTFWTSGDKNIHKLYGGAQASIKTNRPFPSAVASTTYSRISFRPHRAGSRVYQNPNRRSNSGSDPITPFTGPVSPFPTKQIVACCSLVPTL